MWETTDSKMQQLTKVEKIDEKAMIKKLNKHQPYNSSLTLELQGKVNKKVREESGMKTHEQTKSKKAGNRKKAKSR